MNVQLTDAQVAKNKRAAKARYDAHVNIIMVQDAVSKPEAQYKAYLEGPEGLDDRMKPVQGDGLVKKNA